MTSRPLILIAALSGRALAQSARRAGFQPFVVDAFGDLDMREAAAAWRALPDATTSGFSAEPLLAALGELAEEARGPPIGLVLGSGFDHVPDVIDAVSRHHRLIGNTAETVRQAADPRRLGGNLPVQAIERPPVRTTPPENEGDWLLKRVGGGGGLRVTPYHHGQPVPDHHYIQRRVPGSSLSALCIMGKHTPRLVGLSRQWTNPCPGHPYRYGGAVGPIEIPRALVERILGTMTSLAAAFGLAGLVSLDFIVEGDRTWLIEVNPRPGATLDIFDDEEGGLFRAHVESCARSPRFSDAGGIPTSAAGIPPLLSSPARGEGSPGFSVSGQPAEAPAATGKARRKPNGPARAAAYLYADRGQVRVPQLPWPPWTADRSPPGTAVPRHGPVASVLAEGPAPDAAESLCRERLGLLEEMIYERANTEEARE